MWHEEDHDHAGHFHACWAPNTSNGNVTIRLMLYRERLALASVEMDQRRALRLTGELLQTALRRV